MLPFALPAYAHSVCDKGSPGYDETVQKAPDRVSCQFNEPLLPDSIMEVFDHCGRKVDDGEVFVAGYEMSVGLDSDAPGRYTVRYVTHSAQDGHYYGPEDYWFTVAGTAPRCGQSPSPSPTPTRTRGSGSPSTPTPGGTVEPSQPGSSPGSGTASPSVSPQPGSGETDEPQSPVSPTRPPVRGPQRSDRPLAGPLAVMLLIVLPLGLLPALTKPHPDAKDVP